ncbi:hypothetical protein [Absidia glauca]|uniref:Homeobox domain-containing protein n=1 Tax=Absidia glauca TaxID=4829 RepID=A0A168RYS6_ABSGL|nr:hypothetical protein [Absidia glauca]
MTDTHKETDNLSSSKPFSAYQEISSASTLEETTFLTNDENHGSDNDDNDTNRSWSPVIKPRRRFSTDEILFLEEEYDKDINPSSDYMETIAEKLGTTRRVITTWFQNHRAKGKRTNSHISYKKTLPVRSDTQQTKDKTIDTCCMNQSEFENDPPPPHFCTSDHASSSSATYDMHAVPYNHPLYYRNQHNVAYYGRQEHDPSHSLNESLAGHMGWPSPPPWSSSTRNLQPTMPWTYLLQTSLPPPSSFYVSGQPALPPLPQCCLVELYTGSPCPFHSLYPTCLLPLAIPMNRPKFFTTNKKGENYELKAELNSEYRHVRKDAVKKVIANMTVGKDVSGLFPDVLKNMQTEDLELKKLVYLYLMNYAKSQPELVILAVNTFVKDSDDPNPLIRALAIRTMGCLRVDKIMDYLTEPLRKCLKDENPYVRKTAALCVAKLYELNPELTVEQDFVKDVKEMVSDVNPMVVANAVVALADIHEVSNNKDVFVITASILNKLLNALNECTEWGQIAILTALADYKVASPKEAESVCERILPRLQHANGAVVLSVVKVLMINMRHLKDANLIKTLCRKMAPPLVTLLSSPPEVQYIALRNINLVLQRRPEVLSNEMRVFFCKYNDPPYVKMEKLEIMIRLCNDRNVDQLLSELKEYANEVDVDFVRKAVNAIGRCAIKIEEAAERCINVLLDLINTGVSYVVQEAIVVIKDIFRKYPHTYEGIIPTLCENLDALDEPEAKASLTWIIGEYAERIENADDLISNFLENFIEENAQVQLQLLTATVKLFLKKPSENQDLVQRVLQTATNECDNADIRDRAYVYWRLLSTDPQAAKAVVLSDKPPVAGEGSGLSPALLDDLLYHIGTLASVYHKPPETFIAGKKYGADNVTRSVNEHGNDEEDATAPPPKIQEALKNNDIDNLLDLDWDEPAATGSSLMANNDMGDLMSLDGQQQQPTTATNQGGSSMDDIMKLYNNQSSSMSPQTMMASPVNTSFMQPSSSPVQQQQQQQQQPSSTMNDLFDLSSMSEPQQPSTNNNSNTKADPFAGLF